MVLRLVTAPEAEPVTLAAAKSHLRLEETAEDDATIRSLIIAARQHIEEICWRALALQTWEFVTDKFDDDGEGIELPKGTLAEVASVKYVDGDGVLRTMTPVTDYVVDSYSVPGRVRLAYGKSWPSIRGQWDAVRIEYDVGWDFTGTVWDGPAALQQAVLLLVSQMYEHRTPEVTGAISQVSFAVESLIAPYRLMSFK